jgi:lysophospholipase L1-like esterase
VWAVDPAGRTVTDAAMTTGTAVLTSASAGFTAADANRYVVVVGAGASGADLYARINAYTNPTTVALATNAGTTVSGATARIGYALTVDGTHPTPAGYGRMAAALPVATLTP